ncbi:proline--tRNA ligase [Buchnera aphidicola (Melanaphis sacchari)]|uniref:Proline--tRNA ligase n=1 Tax=Buchnera aphidicola (Melanaphis sacchari) TaxID=2173854 RepID=A0A2U8DFF6_9GAMM|nr:proline--tRNA ligase [Buchnera aphidicola]AWH90539.1 proline--tRNA ligase [Buchnera aphidicola (Melanaphis sacchari)]
MRTSQYLLSTLKEIPHDAKIISHQLMLRSGMIRKISSGLYIWLPTGIKVFNKIKKIIREEMKKIQAIEILTPIIQPEELWKKSGRLNLYGKELLKFFDRRQNKFVLGPTNEEIITYFVGKEINSYKNLPLIVYQIQTKFRDEIRPRSGIIRTREFCMKDAYSFHISQHCLQKTYENFYASYIKIFNKMNLKFCIASADSGSMGGNISHEFQALSKNGEDKIVYSKNKLYASNINTAQSKEAIEFLKKENKKIDIHKKSIKSLKNIKNLTLPINNFIKTILVKAKINYSSPFIALLISSEHDLNVFKAEKIDIIQKPLVYVSEKEIISWIGVEKKFLGPLDLKIPIFADISVYHMKNFTIGSNINHNFFINVNWNIDLPMPIFKDLRNVTKKDTSPDGSGPLKIENSIEIGHIFQLGKEYSKKMNILTQCQNNDHQKYLYMGCYGIGITRIIAAIIEQNYDDKGIIWNDSIAPFEVVILPINATKFSKIKKTAEILYNIFQNEKIDVILDDRDKIMPGIMFSEMDLIGIPHQIIVSPRHINENKVEYRARNNKKSIILNIKDVISFFKEKKKIIKS